MMTKKEEGDNAVLKAMKESDKKKEKNDQQESMLSMPVNRHLPLAFALYPATIENLKAQAEIDKQQMESQRDTMRKQLEAEAEEEKLRKDREIENLKAQAEAAKRQMESQRDSVRRQLEAEAEEDKLSCYSFV